MKLLRIALAALLLTTPAHATQRTKAQMESTIDSQLPSNGQGQITAAILRNVLKDMVDSYAQIGLLRQVTSTADTFLASDQGKLVTFCNTSPIASNLPAATGDFASGYTVAAQNICSGAVTITVAAGTINDASTLVLEEGDAALIVAGSLNEYRAVVTYSDFSSFADTVSDVQGSLLYRGSEGWRALAPGIAGQTLSTSGVGQDPFWSSAGTGTVLSITCGAGLSGGTITASGTCSITNTISGTTAGASDEYLQLTFNDRGQLTGVVTGIISAAEIGALTAADIGVTVEAWDADLDAVAALTDTGLAVRTGTATWATRIITSTSGDLDVSNGDGVSGNPDISLPDLITAAGPIGSGTETPVITFDANGRLTAVSTATTAPPFSAVTGQLTLSQLPTIANGTILSNVTGSDDTPSANSFSAVADTVSDTQGTILYRNASEWVALPPGTVGQFLQTNGAGADPTWEAAAGGGTVTSLSQGAAMAFSTDPITTTGTISIGNINALTTETAPAPLDWLLGEDEGGTVKKFAVGEVAKVRAESFIAAASDETTAITQGTSKVTFRMPYAFTISEVRASLTTPQSSGNIFTVDINEGETSILSTKITIDNGETTSTTAATPPVISDPDIADDAQISVDVDAVGAGDAAGLKVYLIGRQP